MDFAVASLEAWMRDYYHAVEYDIGSSGVRDLTMTEFRTICGFDPEHLDEMVFHDSESFGGTRLRTLLAERWTGGDQQKVMVTHGSSEGIYLTMHLAVEPGDEIVVVDPAYQQLYDIAAWRGCRVTRWPLMRDAGCEVDLDSLRELAKSSPKMIVVNFPHNPTGLSITEQQQREIVDIAADVGAWLVWDHAFGELTYEADPLPIPTWYDRSIVFGTFSKSYGLAGMRVGWCVASPDLLGRMALLRDYIALYVSPVLERLTEHAVRNANQIVAMQQEHARKNLDTVQAWAIRNQDIVRFTRPHGGVSTFVEVLGQHDVTRTCRRLAEQHRVLLVPGVCFGSRFKNYVRLGFGGTSEELAAGLARTEQVLREDREMVAAQ